MASPSTSPATQHAGQTPLSTAGTPLSGRPDRSAATHGRGSGPKGASKKTTSGLIGATRPNVKAASTRVGDDLRFPTRIIIGALRLAVCLAILHSLRLTLSTGSVLALLGVIAYAEAPLLPDRIRPRILVISPLTGLADTMLTILVIAATGGFHSPLLAMVCLPVMETALAAGMGWSIPMALLGSAGIGLITAWPSTEAMMSAQTLMSTAGLAAVALSVAIGASVARRKIEQQKAVNESLRADLVRLKVTGERADFLAWHDGVTRLPNRQRFQAQLETIVAVAQKRRQEAALIIFDLDNFALINQEWGHAIGDALLKQVAERLQGCIRTEDQIARVGSDEFGLAIPELHSGDEPMGAARKILSEIARPFVLQGRELHLTACAGVSVYPLDGRDDIELLRTAHAALSRAKQQGNAQVQQFAPIAAPDHTDRLNLETDLRHAIAEGQFMLHYQPQVDVNAGALAGFEALVRWQHPEMGMISPGRFIPLAEETGLIVPMTEWILHEACRQVKEWQDAGLPRARVAVNLSARQFQQKSVVPTVDRALRSTGLDAQWLEVELTESSAILDPDYTVMTIRALQEMGVEVAMDDFGTGYSSLGYLKRLPFDTIKIDQSFIREIANDPGSAAIVTTIITMAQNLGRRVLAEGVETEDQLIFLRMQGCHLIQGYLISRPLAASDIRAMLTIKPSHEVRRYAHFENAPEGLIQTIARYSYPLPPAPTVMR